MTAASNAGRIGVYGAAGSGKSTWVKERIRRLDRLVIFDPLGEYGGTGRLVRSHRDVRALLRDMGHSWNRGFRLALLPAAGAEVQELHRLARGLIQAQAPFKAGEDDRQITLVVEEMNLSFPVAGLPADRMGFGEICSRGRHWGIETIGVSQRPAEINTRFRGNETARVLFRLAEHVDQQWIRRSLGPEAARRVTALSPHEFLFVENGRISDGRNRLGRGR